MSDLGFWAGFALGVFMALVGVLAIGIFGALRERKRVRRDRDLYGEPWEGEA